MSNRGKGIDMKKFAIMAMLAMAANLSSPLMPAAHAAIADEVLAEIVAQNENAARIQDLLALRQDIMYGGTDAIISRVAQAALTQAGEGRLAGVVTTAAVDGDIRAAVEESLREEATAQLAARVAPYSDSLAMLAGLFQDGKIDQNALASIALNDNYRDILTQVLK
jgi:hypothetical protein